MSTELKKSYFITDDGFSIHTFCLTKSITFNEHKGIFNNENMLSKDSSFSTFFPYKKNPNIWISTRFSDYGLNLFLHKNSSSIPHIEAIINPSEVLGDNNLLRIFKFIPENAERAITKIDEMLFLINPGLNFECMTLSRVDLSVNVAFDSSAESSEYLRLIHKTYIPKTYEKVSYNDTFENYKNMNKHSFRIRNFERTLTIYDKLFQMETEHLGNEDDFIEYIDKGLLRFEVALERKNIVDELSSLYNSGNKEAFLFLGNSSKRIILKEFSRVFDKSHYCRYDIAQDIIKSSWKTNTISTKMKDRMLLLIEKTSESNNINSAISNINKDEEFWSEKISRSVLEVFKALSLNPATMKNRSFFLCLPSVISLLETGRE